MPAGAVSNRPPGGQPLRAWVGRLDYRRLHLSAGAKLRLAEFALDGQHTTRPSDETIKRCWGARASLAEHLSVLADLRGDLDDVTER